MTRIKQDRFRDSCIGAAVPNKENVMKNFLKYIICVILEMTSIKGLMPVSADEGTTVKGFCTHLRNFSDNSKNLELVYNTGTKTLREDVYWISVERTKGV